MKKYLFISGLAFTFIACSKKKIPQDDAILGLDYYPTESGKYVIYDVDSTVYTQLPQDTLSFKYRIKEKIADSFTDNLGQPAIRLERYIKHYNASRPYDSIPWSMKEVWMVNANNQRIQVVESNVRFTKLTFPVQEKASWNGNAPNTLGEADYIYDYINRAEVINNVPLDNVLLVNQKNYRTLISYEFSAEKYAKGVGLVSREIKYLLSNTIIKDKPVEDRIESGFLFKQTLVTHGHE